MFEYFIEQQSMSCVRINEDSFGIIVKREEGFFCFLVLLYLALFASQM